MQMEVKGTAKLAVNPAIQPFTMGLKFKIPPIIPPTVLAKAKSGQTDQALV